MYLVDVVLPLPLYQSFFYLSKEFLIPGIRVLVPFRNHLLIGMVKDCLKVTEEELSTEIDYKWIEEPLDTSPLIPPTLFNFLDWVSQYYITPIGLVYKIALPPGVFSLPKRRIYLTEKGKKAIEEGYLPEEFSFIKRKGYNLKYFIKKTGISLKDINRFKEKEWIVIKAEFPKTKVPTETFIRLKDLAKIEEEFSKKEIISYLREKIEVPEKIIKRKFPLKEIKSLLEAGVLEKVEYPRIRKIMLSLEIPKKYELTPLQKEIFEGIKNLIIHGGFKPILLYGVTGSGKSFIYLEIIREILKIGGKVLVLVPEIALTTYMEMLLLNYFKEKIALLHSGLSPSERLSEWMRILNDEVDIIIGTRSAIFAPIKKLGLIIVDEEHDLSYKEETLACKYHARDLALIRGKLENIPVILGSATPSIKSFYFAKKGKYHLFMLKERPFASLPEIKFVESKPFKLISEELKKEIEKMLNKGKSVFLYLNRRGYAPLVECEECHYIWSCPNCGIPLTYHKEENSLLCHYCNFEISSLTVCPQCRGFKMKFKKAGTEKIEEEIKKIFPKVEVIRIDRDAVNTEKKLLQVLEKLYRTEPKIIVGTQMGVHGHNFPEVDLVSILKAEEGLFLPHYKSGERIFQLLMQAEGRAGRKREKGKVIFQSSIKDHYAIKYALKQDYEKFYEEEIKLRKRFLFPPFVRLVVIRIEGIKEEKVKEKCIEAKKYLENLFSEMKIKDTEIMGPAPCPFRKLKGFYRWHIILKTKNYKPINNILFKFLTNFKVVGLKLNVDIDPEDLL
ncbi:MAG: primosomal protein N' [Thermodesulfobacterium geofontis]|uniref:Replication restart protein PriA n=2 Tax=Thermodesulfobacterium geofontis TaxID=1295609 RepID=A0A2N7PNF7_9BACT|nr:MAG: primosomal protein N' [Thermodesulfobacterium geofontis]